jgi:hypothetical protein
MYGTANAKTITVSFWVKSSLTGTFGASLANSNNTLLYNFNYTINAANTWEYKTSTIVGPTSGTWQTTTSAGIHLRFNLGLGATYGSTTTGSWVSGTDIVGNPSATSVVGTNGATLYITGVQLEKGSTATSFDYRPYGTELALCQRYFTKIGDGSNPFGVLAVGRFFSSTGCSFYFPLPVAMRATPSASLNSATYQLTDGTSARSVGAITINSNSVSGCEGDIVTSSATSGNMTQLRGNAVSPNAPFMNLSAEL